MAMPPGLFRVLYYTECVISNGFAQFVNKICAVTMLILRLQLQTTQHLAFSGRREKYIV